MGENYIINSNRDVVPASVAQEVTIKEGITWDKYGIIAKVCNWMGLNITLGGKNLDKKSTIDYLTKKMEEIERNGQPIDRELKLSQGILKDSDEKVRDAYYFVRSHIKLTQPYSYNRNKVTREVNEKFRSISDNYEIKRNAKGNPYVIFHFSNEKQKNDFMNKYESTLSQDQNHEGKDGVILSPKETWKIAGFPEVKKENVQIWADRFDDVMSELNDVRNDIMKAKIEEQMYQHLEEKGTSKKGLKELKEGGVFKAPYKSAEEVYVDTDLPPASVEIEKKENSIWEKLNESDEISEGKDYKDLEDFEKFSPGYKSVESVYKDTDLLTFPKAREQFKEKSKTEPQKVGPQFVEKDQMFKKDESNSVEKSKVEPQYEELEAYEDFEAPTPKPEDRDVDVSVSTPKAVQKEKFEYIEPRSIFDEEDQVPGMDESQLKDESEKNQVFDISDISDMELLMSEEEQKNVMGDWTREVPQKKFQGDLFEADDKLSNAIKDQKVNFEQWVNSPGERPLFEVSNERVRNYVDKFEILSSRFEVIKSGDSYAVRLIFDNDESREVFLAFNPLGENTYTKGREHDLTLTAEQTFKLVPHFSESSIQNGEEYRSIMAKIIEIQNKNKEAGPQR